MAELEQGLEELKVVKQAFKNNFESEDISTNNVEFRNMPELVKGMEKKLPNQTKNVNPTTSEQIVTADSGYKLTQVNVKAVNPSDYYKPEQSVSVSPKTTAQTITPSGNNVYNRVDVGAVTSEIDSNIIPTNIRKGKTILGVTGNLEADKPDQQKTVNPTTSQQSVVADSGYELAKVTVNAVTSAIDNNIKSSNIKKGVSILGVTGTLEENTTTTINLQEKTINPTTSRQSVTADGGYDGLSKVNVEAVIPSDYYKPEEVANVTPTTNAQVITPTANSVFNKVNVSAVTSAIDTNIQPENIKEGVTILGKTGTFKGGITPTGTLNITENGTFDVTNYASAEVDVPSEEPTLITKEITENGIYNATDDNADGYSSVVVNVAGGELAGYNVESIVSEDGASQTLKITSGFSANGNPIEVATDEEMANALTQANVGKVYKFTGTSSTYETDAIYIISEV